MPQCVVIADDLTGGNATGVLLKKMNYQAYTVMNTESMDLQALEDCDCVIYPTDSRGVAPEVAYERVYNICSLLKDDAVKVYSNRIDSTLQGNLGSETDAMLDCLGEDYIAIVAPCFPASGRIVVGGMPLTNITLDDGKTFGIIDSITTGFGGTLGSIGIIIGFGVMMGQIFEVTGAAKRMAFTFLKLFGKKREEEALALTGFLVSIPIFCDSGFVVLSPIAKAISKATKKSVIGLGVALAAGLVITHSLVPPTPGPLGVCGIFGVDVGKFILMTIVLAIPMAIACIAYARLYLSKKILSDSQ